MIHHLAPDAVADAIDRLVAWMSELVTRAGYRRGPSPSEQRSPPMPFEANAARRHHIPKQRHRVTNWPAYDAALRQRGGASRYGSRRKQSQPGGPSPAQPGAVNPAI